MRKSLLVLSLFGLLGFAACGGGNDDPFGGLNPGSGGASANIPAIPLTATVTGKISFEGEVPAPKKISTTSDPGCMNNNLVSEETVVSDGGLENVILYVSGGDIAGKKFPVPTEEVVLDQMGCHYIPHALTIMVGQKLKIVNSDDTAHNVHAWAEVNTPFNESQRGKGVETVKMFDKPEMLLPIRCDVHNWMNSYIGVFEHPLSTVSKTGGAFELKLPAGTYEITAEHEKYGKKTGMVTVTDGGSAELNFSFSAS